jgi:inner membrane protein involved in colicin E2 resistance
MASTVENIVVNIEEKDALTNKKINIKRNKKNLILPHNLNMKKKMMMDSKLFRRSK